MNGDSLRLENSKRPHHLNDERTTHRSWRRGSTIAPDYHTRLRAGRRYRFWIRDRGAWHRVGGRDLRRPSGAQGGRDSSWLDATALDRDVRTRAARASPAPNDGDEVYGGALIGMVDHVCGRPLPQRQACRQLCRAGVEHL